MEAKLKNLVELPYEKFIEKLKDLADDPKINAILNSGRDDGYPDDEKIKFREGVINARKLIPMQKELLIDKSVKWGINGKNIKILKEKLKGRPIQIEGRPIVILNEKYIIDGHHRWAEAYAIDPNTRIIIYDMKKNITPIDAFKIIQLSIAAIKKKIPLSKSEGINLYKMSKKEIIDYISKYLDESVVNVFDKSFDDVVNFITSNLLELIKKNPPEPSAPERLYMPQPGKAEDFDKKLQKGEINYKEPFVKENLNKFDCFLIYK